jgi:hypothetical protein
MPTVIVRPPCRVRAARGPRPRSDPVAVFAPPLLAPALTGEPPADAGAGFWPDFSPELVAGTPSGVGRVAVMVA